MDDVAPKSDTIGYEVCCFLIKIIIYNTILQKYTDKISQAVTFFVEFCNIYRYNYLFNVYRYVIHLF